MATARFTVGAVADTVVVAATTINATLNSVSKTVGMLNSFVDKAAEEQQERYKIEAKTRKHRIAKDAAREMARDKEALDKECSANPEFAKHFNETYHEFMELLEPTKGETNDRGLRVAAE